MFAPQSRQADQTRIIESLARESEFPIDEVAHLYEEELAELGIDARITSFLPIFAIRNVQEALRKRGAAGSPSGSRSAATWFVANNGRKPYLIGSVKSMAYEFAGWDHDWLTRDAVVGWMKWLGLVVATLTVLVVGLMTYGSWRWKEGSTALLARLEAARVPHAVTRYDACELLGLPAPVQRYFRAALTDGQAIVTAVSIRHAGTFNMSATAEQWKPFTSQQRVITRRPGFDWDARVMMFPGLPLHVQVHVHDAYIAGSGLLHGAVLGLVTVVDMADTPEMARGELMRFFAEAAWYPTALLPSQGVRWEAVDDSSAHATLTDGPLTLKLLFRFNAEGLIDTVRAQARERVVDGKTVTAPWQGRYWRYAMQGGMRVPQEGEVAWLLPEGEKPYWRGSTVSSSYEFANSPARRMNQTGS